jgi:hypothetical protein
MVPVRVVTIARRLWTLRSVLVGSACAVAAALPSAARAQRHITVVPVSGPAQLGSSFSVRLRLPADTTLKNAAISLEAFGGAPYGLEAAPATADGSGYVTFTSVLISPRQFVVAQPVHVPVRVHANGIVLDTTSLSFLVEPPTRYLLDAESLNPDSVRLGIKQDLRALVGGEAGGRGVLPVNGAAVDLRLPNGSVVRAISDSSGVAWFRDIIIQSEPRDQVDLSFEVARARIPTRAVKRIVLLVGPPANVELFANTSKEYRVDHAFVAWAKVADAAGNARRKDTVDLAVAGGGAYLRAGTGDSSVSVLHLRPEGNGFAKLEDVRYVGPTGVVRLIASAGVASDTVELTVSHGNPDRLRILQQPSTSIVADSAFEFAPLVRVEDAAGNPVPKVTVTVRLRQPQHSDDLCKNAPLAPSSLLPAAQAPTGTPSTANVLGFMRGQTVRVTDSVGVVRFDSLAVVGPGGWYTLEFRRLGMPDRADGEFSNPMCYDVDRAYNRNFVIISAIRSIAGSVTPPDEFFDIRFRFRFGKEWHGMVHSDLSVIRRSDEDTDSVRSTTKRLVDAALLLNWTDDKYMQIRDALSGTPERFLFVGAQLRLFNTVPYFGVHVGSVELARSPFHGSSLSIGFVTPLQRMPVKVENEAFRPTPGNIVIDAFLRSSGVDFLKYLNVRGGVLVPMTKGQRPASRIVLAVPVGGLISF